MCRFIVYIIYIHRYTSFLTEAALINQGRINSKASKTHIIFLPDTVIVPDEIESLNISYWLRNIVAECTYRKYVQNILTSMKNWDVMFQLLETQKMCSYATGSLTWKKLCYLLIREQTSHEIESRMTINCKTTVECYPVSRTKVS
jgi:hypothetical protein